MTSLIKKCTKMCFLVAAALLIAACGEETVTVSFPAGFVAGEDTELFVEQLKGGEGNKKVRIEDDGTITLVVTEEKYNLIMDNMNETIESMYETIGSEDGFFKTVKAIEHNGDYTQLTLTVDRAEYEKSNESESVEQIVYLARLYQIYSLNNDAVVAVDYIDEATGEVYKSERCPVKGNFKETETQSQKE